MYEESDATTPPPLDAILWRYMDFAKFVSLLDKSSLFFCSAGMLGDPFEGTWSKANFATLSARYSPEMAETTRIALYGRARLRAQYSVNCWHWNSSESDAMWGLYATRSAGIAIQTDFKSLAESFRDDIAIYAGIVNYVDYDTDAIPDDHILHTLLHKRHHFEHEREVRAIVVQPAQPSELQVGRYCEVDLSMLIKRVVVSPLAPVWLSELVKSVAVKYGLKAPVIVSELAAPPQGADR